MTMLSKRTATPWKEAEKRYGHDSRVILHYYFTRTSEDGMASDHGPIVSMEQSRRALTTNQFSGCSNSGTAELGTLLGNGRSTIQPASKRSATYRHGREGSRRGTRKASTAKGNADWMAWEANFRQDSRSRIETIDLVEDLQETGRWSAPVVPDWLEDPAQLLEKLESRETTPEDRHKAVLFSEVAEFTEGHRVRLLNALSIYIAENRFTTDEELITTTGSAIRKYAMNMGEERFNAYVEWLEPSNTQRVHHQVELELVQGASWRLQYIPISGTPDVTRLRNGLHQLALDYLQPRLILDKNYAATTLCAIVAVVLMDGITREQEASLELLRRTTIMNLKWFAELISHGVKDAIQDVRRINPVVAERVALIVAKA